MSAERMALLSQLNRQEKGGIRDRIDARDKRRQAEMIADMLNAQKLEANEISMNNARRSGRQSDLLFSKEFEISQSRLAEQKRKNSVTSAVDSYDAIEEAVKLYGITKDDSYLKKASERLSESGQDSLIPLMEGIAKGDKKAAEVFQVQRGSALEDAYDLEIRERPQNKNPDIRPAKNKTTGQIEYVDFNDASIMEGYEPPGDSISVDWKPAINKETSQVELVDWNSPDLGKTHMPVPKGHETYMENGKLYSKSKEAKRSADQEKASGFYDRMLESAKIIDDLNYDPTGTWETIKGVTNTTSSSERQRYNQAAQNWIRANLRRESGAVIGDDEMEQEFKVYFPVFGDDQETIKQKAKARKVTERAMAKSAGRESAEDDVVLTHPTLGDVTEADIQTTMANNNLTREEVLEKLNEG